MISSISSSKFFGWLRKKLSISKPYALSFEDWKTWEKNTRKEQPVGYWLTEVLPDIIQIPIDTVCNPYYNAKSYIRNRFILKTHALTSKLPRGVWQEYDQRLLHCLFDSLVDYVEVELAHMAYIFQDWNDKNAVKKYKKPLLCSIGLKEWRSPEAGLAYLSEQCESVYTEDWFEDKENPQVGKPTPHAEAAKKVYELYNWWKNIYPKRQDPHVASGWDEVFREVREANGGKLFVPAPTQELRDKELACMLKMQQIEEEYAQEEAENMKKLIDVRQYIWT